MGRSKLLALIFVSGYIVAFVPVLWARYDISRIPRSIWRYTAPHPRQLWRGGLLVAYVCAGWPGLVVAVGWRFSSDRRALREEWAHLHRRNVEQKRAPGPAPDPAPAAPAVAPVVDVDEPEIVLAEHEALDEAEQPVAPSTEEAPPRSS